MRPILITGGAGLLALNWALTQRNGNVVILGLHQRDVMLTNIYARKINLKSTDCLVRELDAINPEVVVHTAGLTDVEECEISPEMARHVNVDLAVNVAQACSKLGFPLIHISTDHLFAGKIPFIDENQTVKPLNVYALTKAEAEYRVLEILPQALVVRTNFYAWGTSYRQSFSDFVIKTLRAGKSLTLFDDVYYTPILAEIVALTCHELINLKANGVFHVVGDERVSKFEFGLKIAQKFKLDFSLINAGRLSDQTRMVRRPYDMSLSNNKTCNLLGRKLGSVDEHIARLYQQEQNGLAQEILKL